MESNRTAGDRKYCVVAADADMFARVNNSFQSPTAAQLEEAADIKATFDVLSAKRAALRLP